MKKLLLLLFTVFIATSALLAQRTVRGTVMDDSGTPLIGASVVVKENPKVGTITDLDGKFSVKIDADAKNLLISFIGFTPLEVAIGSSNDLNITLSSGIQLEDVVVTSLGITREKKSLGYAFTEVTGDQITKAGNPNIVNALAGKVAGVEIKPSSGMPGAPSQVLIRGSRAFSGDNTPLYVVDGMPISSGSDYSQNVTGAYYSNRSLDINPDDIESMSVLKGQAAAALYGIKASNGVILITTKSGKGLAKGKPVISLSTNYTTDVVAKLPDVQQTYAQGYYLDASTLGFAAANSFSWGPKISDLPDNATYGGNSKGQPGLWWDPYKAAWVAPEVFNNAKNFFSNNGTTLGTNLNISQATEFGDYTLGFGTTNQDGIVTNTGMDRYTAKLGANAYLGKKWTAGFSANYSDVKLDKLPSGNDSWLFTVYGAPASFDLVGTPYHMPGTLGQYRQISYRRGAVGENPRWAVENNEFSEKTKRFYGSSYLEFKPLDWLKVRYQFGLDSYSSDFIDYLEMGSAGTGQALPTAAQYTNPTKPDYTYVAPTGGKLNLYGVNRTNLNSLLTFSVKRQLTESINAVLDFGNDIADNKYTSYTMLGTGYTVPGWKNMSNASKQTADNSLGHNRTVGFFGNLSIDYNSMIYLGATGRNDIVSTMPRGSRSFFYPSVSLGFIFTELEALQNSILSFGKIRASYANVGQAGTFSPVTFGLTNAGSGFLSDGLAFPLGGVSGYGPSSTLYDPNLKPQNTRTMEAGLELKFFNNRVGLDYAYSDQLAKDQIFAVPLAGSTGYSQIYKNAGTMTVKGHEIVLNIVPVKTNNFEWNFTTLFTKYVNECVELAEGVENISLGGYVTPNIRASAGDTYPSIYGEQFLKTADGKILIDDDPTSDYYGMPLIGEFGKIGDVSPNFMMVFSNSFKYKFITLSAQLDWKDGGQMYSGSNRLMDLYGSSARTEDRTTEYVYEGVKLSTATYDADKGTYTGGTANDIKRGGPDDQYAYADLYNDVLSSISEAHIYSTSFLKLREVSLNLMLPKKWLSSVKIQSVSLDLIARNFLLWSKLPNFDPEASQGMGNMQGGMDYMSLPQTSSYGIGLNITF